MKYEESIEIDLPVAKVIELFDNEQNMFKWQKGLTKVELISGDSGKPGAKTRMTFKMGKKPFDLVETIIKFNLPEEFSATYETKGVYNLQNGSFEEVSLTKTRWVSESEFRFDSLPMKIMSFFMKGVFRKQSCSYMQAFKEFAENGTDVNQPT